MSCSKCTEKSPTLFEILLTMRSPAIVVREVGGPDVLVYEQIEIPAPPPGQVQIRQAVMGVNYIDTYLRKGLYKADPPFTPGDEGSGVVTTLGEGVTGFEVGERVAYCSAPLCGYSEIRNVPATQLISVPADVSAELSGATLVRGLTVEYLLYRLYPLAAGETILVQAAAGSLGLLLCQWAKHIGATVIGTAGSAAKAELAARHGCDHTIEYRSEDFVERVKDITHGKLVDVVYDSVGKDTFARSIECLRPRGMMVSYGNASGKPDPLDLGALAARSLFITRPTLYTYCLNHDEMLTGAQHYFALVADGTLKVPKAQPFALREAAAAHRALEDRNVIEMPYLVP